ncbi:hypothetical protein NQ318_013328 [Aromia moschata]|uniref:Phospholipase A2 n=1 Tax=Aromia moschata TaxID=1265417 RepID=A0AAV8Y0T5_9CUCU|nr:hypothetical protein NQ318_013328 [Aromia moschata]
MIIKMKGLVKILIALHLLYINVEGLQIMWDNSVDYDFNDIDISTRSEQVRLPNRFFIFPAEIPRLKKQRISESKISQTNDYFQLLGTKWCGAGNIAENDDDLGRERDTDKCCRNHDFCPDIIEGYQTKYNLTNPSFYTRLQCNCDTEFYKCLKSVNTKTSTQVGHIYFTALGTQCYKEDYPVTGCDKYTYFP